MEAVLGERKPTGPRAPDADDPKGLRHPEARVNERPPAGVVVITRRGSPRFTGVVYPWTAGGVRP